MLRYHLELWNSWTSQWELESEHNEFEEAQMSADFCVHDKWRIIDEFNNLVLDEHDPFVEQARLDFARIEASRRWNENRIQREQNLAIRQRLDRIAARQRGNLRIRKTLLHIEEKVDWAREGF